MEKRQEEGRAVLTKNKKLEELNDTDLKKLLAWYGVPGKETKTITDRRQKWSRVKPPPCPIWGAEKEEELQRLKSEQIDMRDTEIGKLKTQQKLEFEASFKAMNKDERKSVITKLKEMDGEDVEDDRV